jgi:hypothetical protein
LFITNLQRRGWKLSLLLFGLGESRSYEAALRQCRVRLLIVNFEGYPKL